MKINPSLIFRAYDIRGIYPEELNKEIAYKIGQSFVAHLKVKNVVIGRDGRLSSPILFKALVDGIISQGVDVFDIGEVPTECLYFTVSHYNYDAGIMITASHNPKEYNGFKMIKRKNKRIDIIRGEEMEKIIEKNNVSKFKKKGIIKKIDIWQNFLNHIFSFANVNKIKPFKVVMDASNGMAGKVIPQIAPKLPIEIISLNLNQDGNFPNHSPNPLLKGTVDQISREIIEKKADFGFIFDGDADRIFLVDELGNLIKGDVVLLLLAKYFLKKYPGKAVAFNLVCSKAVPEFVKKWGGKPIRTPVGFVYVREGLLKNDGIVSGEVSGHFSFRDNYYLDSGFISFLVLLEIISDLDKKVSEIVAELSPYAKLPEFNFEVKDKEMMLNKIKERFSDGKQDYLDGITIEYDNWWFNVRPSNTEPLLRLTIEAKTKELLEEKFLEIKSFLSISA